MPVREGHGKREFAGQGFIKPAPGVESVHVQICGEAFQLEGHLVSACFPQAAEPIGRVRQRGIGGEGGELRGAERSEMRTQTGFDFRQICLAAGKPGFIGLHGFVARVISGQAAEIGGKMPQFHRQLFIRRQRCGRAGAGGWFTLSCQTSGELVFESQIIRRAESGEPGLKGPAVGRGSGGGFHAAAYVSCDAQAMADRKAGPLRHRGNPS